MSAKFVSCCVNSARRVCWLPVLAVALLCGGCAMEPWVKPYERELLADPIMSFSRDPVSERFLQHVQDVREGARGAGTSEGGGCGCN